jgi:hypothetical protein
MSVWAAPLNPQGMVMPGSAGRVTITLAATTTLLHAVSPGKTARVRGVRWFNTGATSPRLVIGETDDGTAGGVFTARMVDFDTIAGRGGDSDHCGAYEFDDAGNIFAQITAANTGVQVELIVEEY